VALHETYYSAKAIRNSSWIPSHLLQAIFPSHLPALTHIINTSLLTGTFPNAFKQAWVTPLLKKTTLNTSLTDSYRPVSSEDAWTNELFSTSYPHFCQSIIYWMLTNQDSDVEIELRLLSVTEDLRIAKADSKSSGLILPDLSAAFDTVNHQILLSTLSSLGITGIPIRWFESYLNGRSFKVAWGWRYPQNINWSLGILRDRFLDPSSSPHTLHHWVPSYKHMVSHTIAMLMTRSSISHFDEMI